MAAAAEKYQHVEPTPIAALDVVQKVEAFYKMGRLDWLLRDYQLPDYRDFRRWNVMRQLPEYQTYIEAIGALYDNMWVDECGRRYGKTVQWLIRDYEEAVRRPGARGLIACAFQKNIGEIIVPLTKVIFKDAPDGYFPEYRSTKGAEHECLYIPATDSIIKLVGIDKHPDATRGQFLDFAHISEAGFVNGLAELVRATINPQFIGRPWAWVGLESSTAKIPDCDFNMEFREDARLRGAYRMRTIRDNLTLSDSEVRKEERRCGGAESVVSKRELYCITTRDPDDMVIPEFDELWHVADPEDWPTPKYALAHVGIDPGTTDPLGLVFGYLDWMKQTIVIQGAWMKPNASTGEVSGIIRDFESRLWGTTHKEIGAKGRDVSIAEAETNGAGRVWAPPSRALTFWDTNTKSLRANPYSRISDVSNRFILDLAKDHGLECDKADKGPGSADADLQHLRMLFEYKNKSGLPRIVILKNGLTEPLIAQLRSGMWATNDKGRRTDWMRSKTLGHLDCIAALKYMVRDVKLTRNPNRPDVVDIHSSEVHIPEKLRDTVRGRDNAPAFGGRSKVGQAAANGSRGFGR